MRVVVVVALVALTACARGSEESAGAPEPVVDSSVDTHVAVEDGGATFDVAGDVATEVLFDAPSDAPPGCATGEICGNGLDDDCNGKVDDGCTCQPGKVASCFRGPASARGVGLCADGTMVCVGSTEFGTWGPCEGDVLPTAEVCDPGGRDENCNGSANEDCECSEGAPPVPCGSDVGACKKGTQSCVAGKLGPCVGAVDPKTEICNGIDDDCDGKIDEDLVRSCGSSVGACKPGTETCAAGAWGPCTGAIAPKPEACNGVDDDCDGEIDEGLTEPCGSSVGACKAGTRKCIGGVFGACEGAVGPSPETCNNIDDDCDGEIDEGLVRTCGKDVGRCKSGKETCTAGVWGACVGSVGPIAEVCDGVVDDDCDGSVDNGCSCVSGATKACGSSIGACKPGTMTCTDGKWGACVGEVAPKTEACNGVDDDCDGLVDEGCDCITGGTRACGSSVGACKPGTETCGSDGKWGPCTGGVAPSPESCNKIDDDCDGLVDEGDVCPKLPPVATCPGSMSALVGTPVTLSGGGSDPDGGTVSYAWTVTSAPTGSTAKPTPATSATTSFTADAAGTYILSLCVTDDEGVKACCTVTLTASSPCTAPTAPSVSTCGTSWDRRPIVEFTAIPSGITYEVFKSGDASPLATLTTTGQNYHRPATEIGAGSAPPGTSVSLYVRACRASDPTCCATSTTVTTKLVESCTTAIAPTSSNVVFSEYLVDGDGGACPGADCEAGEAIEITNLSHCPVTLNGVHFSYASPSGTTPRWMNFGPSDVIPPRGVYVAIRNRAKSKCSFPFLGAEDAGLFGLKISTLAMEGDSLTSGWFNNAGGGSSHLRVATGAYVDLKSGTTIAIVSPYKSAPQCSSIGFDAVDACGDIASSSVPSSSLTPNQLGRLWHPCDAVVAPSPATCK